MDPRLDELLVQRGFASTLKEAQALILRGWVYSEGKQIDKAGTRLDSESPLEIRGPSEGFVSRGGKKLESALTDLGITVEDLTCVDLGASTGGFTDCLLRHGARRVYAFDVGSGQLDWSLRNDDRVIVRENFNVRNISPSDMPEPVDFLVSDLSFISLTLILPRLALFRPVPSLVLIKPQFEATRSEVEKGGLITSDALREEIIQRVVEAAQDQGFDILGRSPSALKGRKGNREEFLYLR